MIGILSSIFGKNPLKTVGGIIDNVITNKEEKIKALTELQRVENLIEAKFLDLQMKSLEAKEKIITTELKSDSWMMKNWRPILMYVLIAIIVLHYIVAPVLNLKIGEFDDSIWSLINMAMGGYILGIGGKKIIEHSKWSNKK